MKKVIVLFVALLMCVSSAFCADFSPTLLKVSAPPAIQYDFDGSELEIPVSVKGTPATLVFCVFTKGQAGSIGETRNGYLGWHFVNQIDTCIYYDPLAGLVDPGNTSVVWDGNDQDGNAVPAGDYTYYVWGIDTQTYRQAAVRDFRMHTWITDILQTTGEDGNPLVNPVYYSGGQEGSFFDEPMTVIHNKWIIGSDPEDATLKETCTASIMGRDNSAIVLDTMDHSMWFKRQTAVGGMSETRKYEWVPNGAALLQTDWGEDGIFSFQLPGEGNTNALSLGWMDRVIFTSNHDINGDDTVSELVYVDMDEGTEITRVDLSDWWVRFEDKEAGSPNRHGGPNKIKQGQDGLIHFSYHGSCLLQAIDPSRNDYEGGTMEDFTLWINGNGDLIGDKNFEEDAAVPWACMDYNHGDWILENATDNKGFHQCSAHGVGTLTFGLFAPDGTGIGWYYLPGTEGSGTMAQDCVDTGSAYDGYYTDNQFAEDAETRSGRWFVGMDSFMGVITSDVAVEDDAPAAFAVAQNSPNPFNPSTTISFTIAEAGNVTIDVFNVAGQKVGTIANEFRGAGSHSVTWDASEFSAGVYFYTVKSDDLSKTMKMTLLK